MSNLKAELAKLREERDALKRNLTINENGGDAEIAAIVGPILRETYGETVELGHYKVAIAAWKNGRSGMLVIMTQLGEAKLRAERAESALAEARNKTVDEAREEIFRRVRVLNGESDKAESQRFGGIVASDLRRLTRNRVAELESLAAALLALKEKA